MALYSFKTNVRNCVYAHIKHNKARFIGQGLFTGLKTAKPLYFYFYLKEYMT